MDGHWDSAISLAAPSAAPAFDRIFSGTIFAAHLVLQVKFYIPLCVSLGR